MSDFLTETMNPENNKMTFFKAPKKKKKKNFSFELYTLVKMFINSECKMKTFSGKEKLNLLPEESYCMKS